MNEPIPKPCKCGNTLKQGKSADTPEGAIEAWNKEGAK